MNDQQKLKQIEDTLATGNIDVSAVATLIGMEPHRVKDALEKLAPYAQGPEKNAKILDEMLSEIERAIKKADSSQFNEISSDALEKTSRLTSRIKGKL
jgi:hypothetical protein